MSDRMDAIDETAETEPAMDGPNLPESGPNGTVDEPNAVTPAPPKQYNKHDVKATQARCNALLKTISAKGAQVDVQGLTRDAGLYALSRLLVQKGLIGEDELEGERLALIEQGLQDTLMQVEEQRLQAAKPKPVAVRQPGIAVARR